MGIVKTVSPWLNTFLASEDGPTAVEYAVLLALIVVAAIAAIHSLGGGVQGRWEQNASSIMSSMEGARS